MIYKSNINKELYRPNEVASILGLHPKTIANYCDQNKLDTIRTDSNQRRITKNSLINYLNSKNMLFDDTQSNKHDIIYARVSSNNQKVSGDLDRQINYIKNYVINQNPNNILIKYDVASSLNDNRKELNNILNLVMQNKVNRIFIMYKDRLTRFGFNYIKQICDFHNVEIIIVSSEENNQSLSEELAEDIISIIHSFSGKLYGMRNKIKNSTNQIEGDNY